MKRRVTKHAPIPVHDVDSNVEQSCYIDGVPTETLYDIFLTVVQESLFDGGPNSGVIWILNAVCRRWRTVCLDNAQLWSYFSLCPCWRQKSADFCTNRTRLQLERSQSTPIFIDASRNRRGCHRLRDLCGVTHRWEAITAHLEGFKQAIKDAGPAKKQWVFPAIKKLEWFEDIEEMDGEGESFIFDVLKAVCPKVLGSKRGPTVKIPLGQLTTLSLCLETDHDALNELISVFAECQHLVELAVRFREPVEGKRGREGHVALLPKLKILRLLESALLLWYLKTPALRELTIRPGINPVPADMLASLIKRSSCRIQTFQTIIHEKWESWRLPHDYRGDYLTPLLKLLPDVESLSLHHSGRTDPEKRCNKLLKQLTCIYVAGSVQCQLCPGLMHLQLHDIDFNVKLLKGMVESRMTDDSDSDWEDSDSEDPSPLRSIEIYQRFWSSSTPSYEKLESGPLSRKYAANGFSIRFFGKPRYDSRESDHWEFR